MSVKIALLALLSASCLCSQTTISDTVYDAAGTKATGTISILPSCPFTAADSRAVAQKPIIVYLTGNGPFSVSLEPTTTAIQGCANYPNQGIYYTATYQLTAQSQYSQIWIVPPGGPYTVSQVWDADIPGPFPPTIQLSWLAGDGAGDNAPMCYNLSTGQWGPGTCGGGGGGGNPTWVTATNPAGTSCTSTGLPLLYQGIFYYCGPENIYIPSSGIYYVSQYGGSLAATVAAAQAAGGTGGGGIIMLPAGNTNLSSTLTLGVFNSGIIIMGQGVPYDCTPPSACPGGSVLTWTGPANQPMITLNGAYHTMIRDMYINGSGTAGQGIQYISTGSTTSQNDVYNVEVRYIQGTPGNAIELGVTAVANVSEIRLAHINEQTSVTGLYLTGGQTFVWCDTCYFLANSQYGINLQTGFFTLNHGEFSGEGLGSVYVGGDQGGFISLSDMDYEDPTPFLTVADATNAADFPIVKIDSLRCLYDAPASHPGTLIQWGVSTGAGGSLTLTNSKLASLYPNTVSLNFNQGEVAVALYVTETGNSSNIVGTFVTNYTGYVYTNQLYEGHSTNNFLTLENLPNGQSDSTISLTIKNAAGSTTGSADYGANFIGNSFASTISAQTAGISGGWVYIGDTSAVRFSSTSTYNGSPDGGLSRCGIGCIAAGNGSTGNATALFKSGGLGYGGTKYSVAGTPLPACASGTLLEQLAVSDATATAGSAYVGGGTYTAWVDCTQNSSGGAYTWIQRSPVGAGGVLAPTAGGTGVSNTATLTLGTSNQNWATLGTGLVKVTTGTGALSIGAGTDVTALFGNLTPSISTPLYGDGNVYQNPISSAVVGTDANGHLVTSSASGTGTVTVYMSGSLTDNCPVLGAPLGAAVIQCSTLNTNGGGIWWPASDSTAAFEFDQANGTTPVFAVDTTNSRTLFASGSTSFPGIAGLSYPTTGLSFASSVQINVIHGGAVTASLTSNQWYIPSILYLGTAGDTPVTRNAAGTVGMLNLALGTGLASVGVLDADGPINFAADATPVAPNAGLVTSGGSCTAGSHSWEVTFVNSAGESLPSAASPVKTCITSTGQTVPLAAIPLGPRGTTGRNIYATKSGNTGSYYLIATSPVIADNTTTSYSFTIADASFTATTAPTSNTTAIGIFQVAGVNALTLTGTSVIYPSVTFSTLPAGINGAQVYCSDCQVTTVTSNVVSSATCTSGGTGAMAMYIASTWKCTYTP